MKINPQSFFNFCANHVPLLRALSERGGELSEMEVMPDPRKSVRHRGIAGYGAAAVARITDSCSDRAGQ